MRISLTDWVFWVLPLWAAGCLAGFVALWSYANTAEAGEAPSVSWSLAPDLRDPDGRPTLVMYAHPRCPCTRASLRELARLQRDANGRFATAVVFYEPAADRRDQPTHNTEDWRTTDLWRFAQTMPETRVVPDPGGAICTEAGATVSGTVALHNGDGRVLFWGGITPSRGHEGDSAGALSIRHWLRTDEINTALTPVYGCGLRTPAVEDACAEACGGDA